MQFDNVAPVIDIFGSVDGRDLGGVSRDINKIIDSARTQLPRGSRVVVRGQVQTMQSSYTGLLVGLVFAILLVYLLIRVFVTHRNPAYAPGGPRHPVY